MKGYFENRFISPVPVSVRLHVPSEDIRTLCRWKQNLLARRTFRPFGSSFQPVLFKYGCGEDAWIIYYSMAYFVSPVLLQTLNTLISAKRRHNLDHAHRKSLNSFDQKNELASQSLHPNLPLSRLRDEVRGCEIYVHDIRACVWGFQSSCRTEIGTPSHSSPQLCRSS